jgi:outer membrane protein TolC
MPYSSRFLDPRLHTMNHWPTSSPRAGIVRLTAMAAYSLGLLLCAPREGWGQTSLPEAPSTAQAPSATFARQYLGSAPEGKLSPQPLKISFQDAIARGLRNNLGVLLSNDNTIAARGDKWKELSALLPDVSAAASESAAKINLAAEGFRVKGGAVSGIPAVVGPFGFFDARVYAGQSFDLHAFRRERGAEANEKAEKYSYKDARDLVVLAVGNAYLEAIAGAARVDTAEAQVATAQALHEKTRDQQKAGVIPAIDALRAQVEYQARQQQLIVARNDYAKQKLTLSRAIGLPLGQEFVLTEKLPYEPLVTPGIEESLRRAYASRSDYLAAAEQVRAAEYFRRAATAERYPAIELAANYGDSAITLGSPEAVFEASATLRIPVFTGGRTHADVLQAEATLRQARSELENLRGQIDYDVRTALLDLNAAADQVEVARSSVDLADQTLDQAKDRFSAGVADNLEVIQAQEAVAAANENYISGLYAHNIAKVALARAIGFAEEGVKQYLQSRP